MDPNTLKLIEDTSSKIGAVIESLAEKLGTTAEHVWGILVKQAFVEGIAYIIIIALMLVLSITSVIVTCKNFKKWGGNESPAVLAVVLSAAMCLVTLLAIGHNMSTIITAFVNPEYSAIKEIARLLSIK